MRFKLSKAGSYERAPSGADALDSSNLLLIAWLNEIRMSTSFWACDNFYRANDAYLEACLVKVVHVVVHVVLVDAVLGFGLLYQLEPRANHLRVFLLYPLTVLCLIESYFKLI